MRTFLATVFVIICAGGFWFYYNYIGPHRHDESKPPLETGITGKIATEVTLFANRNGGTWPTSWLQLTNLTKHNCHLVRRMGLTIPEYYAFAPTNLIMTGYHEGTVIILQRKPTKSSGSLGRYYVYYNSSDDEFRGGHMPEGEVQSLLTQYGEALPPPNPEEVRAAREAVHKAEAEEKAVLKAAQEAIQSSFAPSR